MRSPETALTDILARIRAAAPQRDREGGGLETDIGWLREAGLLTAAMPDTLSGTTGWSDDPLATLRLLRAIGAASLPVGRLFEGHINAAQLLGLYAGPALRRSCTEAVRRGALLGVWGADGTEPLTVRPTASGLVLSGQKSFCSGLGLVEFALVSARDEGATRLFLVDVRDARRADPAQWQVSGMRATVSGGYDFNGMALPPEAAVGDADAFFAEPYFLGGMYRFCAVQVGALDEVVAQTAQAMRARGRGDDRLSLYRLGQIASYRALAAQITEGGARRLSGNCAHEEIAGEAVLMREGVERCITAVLEIVERDLGTLAHRETCAISRLRRDLSFYIRQAAVDERLIGAGRRVILETP